MPEQAARDCADRSASLQEQLERGRSLAEKMSPGGARDFQRQFEEPRKAEFLRSCARFGYVAPDSPELAAQNKALSDRIASNYSAAYEKRIAWETQRRAEAAPPPSYAGKSGQANREQPAAPRPIDKPWMPSKDELEMQQCVDDWETEIDIRRTPHKGPMSSTEARFDRERQQIAQARFLPKCGKYGFDWPRDQAGEARNTRVMEQVRRKLGSMREARRDEQLKQQVAREAESRAREKAAEKQRECKNLSMAIDQMRSELSRARPNEKEAYQREVDRAEEDRRAKCQ